MTSNTTPQAVDPEKHQVNPQRYDFRREAGAALIKNIRYLCVLSSIA